MRVVVWLVGQFACLLYNHPPRTSFYWGDEEENRVERHVRIAAAHGVTVTVQCLCGRRMVDPIWRPWWRKP